MSEETSSSGAATFSDGPSSQARTSPNFEEHLCSQVDDLKASDRGRRGVSGRGQKRMGRIDDLSREYAPGALRPAVEATGQGRDDTGESGWAP